VASGGFTLKKPIENLPDISSWALGRCNNPDRDWFLKPCLFAVWTSTWRGETEGTLAHRAGQYENEYVEVFGSAPVFKK
jgi:hypothetical protein